MCVNATQLLPTATVEAKRVGQNGISGCAFHGFKMEAMNAKLLYSHEEDFLEVKGILKGHVFLYM